MHKSVKVRKVPGKIYKRERYRERLRKYIDFFQDFFLYINESLHKLEQQLEKAIISTPILNKEFFNY